MQPADFDAWRANYRSMTYEQAVEFANQVYREHPVQAGWVLNNGRTRWTEFLKRAIHDVSLPYVLELGGHCGEMSEEMLRSFPSLVVWCNTDLASEALDNSVHGDCRYVMYHPPTWVWHAELPPANILLAAHFVEHIRYCEFRQLLGNLPDTVKWIGLQSPLPQSGGTDWNGYHGSHILEVSWAALEDALGWYCYDLIEELSAEDFRAFRRRQR